MALRHVPQRTCVACRVQRPKRDMVRVVRDTDRVVGVDPTGKRSGRGAYICRVNECWRTALKRKVLDRALKTEISDADRDALLVIGASWSESAAVSGAAREEGGAG